MPRKPIKLTKLDAAARQLETALDLWFHSGEPVSIHALAAAAHKVVDGVCKHRGKEAPYLLNPTGIKPGMEKQYFKLIHSAANFFKHADNDPDALYEFNEDATIYMLNDAVMGMKRLGHPPSFLMITFHCWFAITFPQYFGSDFLPRAEVLLPVDQLRRMSRIEFLEYFTG